MLNSIRETLERCYISYSKAERAKVGPALRSHSNNIGKEVNEHSLPIFCPTTTKYRVRETSRVRLSKNCTNSLA